MECCVDDGWRMPDVLWERMELLLPKYRRSRKGGRPRLSMRDVADGIFYVLRTGCQWKAAPRAFGFGQQLASLFSAVDQARRVSPAVAHVALGVRRSEGHSVGLPEH
jgi:transposase